jgi:hypothetical protein
VTEQAADALGNPSDTGNTMDARADFVEDGPPVCEIPAYAKLPGDPTAPVVPAPPKPEPPHVLQAPPGDVIPVGVIITRPSDGTRWQKHVSESPFGVTAYYEQVQ